METKIESHLISLSHQEMLALDRDYLQTAKKVKLRYVSDSMPGITRQRKGNGFTYSYKGKTIKDENELSRIKKLVIPPAWTRVWICPYDNGHIQATGYELRQRKQYRYH